MSLSWGRRAYLNDFKRCRAVSPLINFFESVGGKLPSRQRADGQSQDTAHLRHVLPSRCRPPYLSPRAGETARNSQPGLLEESGYLCKLVQGEPPFIEEPNQIDSTFLRRLIAGIFTPLPNAAVDDGPSRSKKRLLSWQLYD